ncbi:MAG: hypothetical protein RMJ54_12780 [Roseiflexaceae bacterium]|nr:hypothetical protein [Roseiflexaceae bacterium]
MCFCERHWRWDTDPHGFDGFIRIGLRIACIGWRKCFHRRAPAVATFDLDRSGDTVGRRRAPWRWLSLSKPAPNAEQSTGRLKQSTQALARHAKDSHALT